MAPRAGVSSRQTAAEITECPSSRPLPLYRKLLLTATMTGNEMGVSFQQLYEVTLLQLLGVPVPFVSLYPVIAGPLAMLLVAINGYISDKGTNHRYRKIALLIFNSVLTLSGIAMIVVACRMQLATNGKNPRDAGLSNGSTRAEANEMTTAGLGNFSYRFTSRTQFTAINVSSPEFALQEGGLSVVPTATPSARTSPLPPEEDEDQDLVIGSGGVFDLPTTAVLGMLGFCFMDLGYDTNIAASRACLLACSPVVDHTSLLVLALVSAALGGILNCALGLVDLKHLLGLGGGEGSLVPQTMLQLLLTSVVLVVCLASTVTTAVVNLRNLDASLHEPFSKDDGENSETEEANTDSDARERSYGTFNDHEAEYDTAFIERKGREQPCPRDNGTDDNTARMNSASECRPKSSSLTVSKGLRKASRSHDFSEDQRFSMSTDFTAKHSLEAALYQSNDFSNLYLSQELGGSLRRGPDEKSLVGSQDRTCCGLDALKVTLGLACLCTFLATSILYSYNAYSSQFLGNVVLGGDLHAPEGSAELKAYEKGMSIAAAGLLLFNCSYVTSSVLQSKLLKLMGLRLDFCLLHAVMATAILLMLLTEEVAAYFVTNVCYGFQRSAMYSVPFIVAKSYIHDKRLEEKGGSALGKIVALVSCMIPLNFCTIYIISGPLISLTSYNGSPLLMASVSTFLAAFLFTLYGRC